MSPACWVQTRSFLRPPCLTSPAHHRKPVGHDENGPARAVAAGAAPVRRGVPHTDSTAKGSASFRKLQGQATKEEAATEQRPLRRTPHGCHTRSHSTRTGSLVNEDSLDATAQRQPHSLSVTAGSLLSGYALHPSHGKGWPGDTHSACTHAPRGKDETQGRPLECPG